MTTLVLDDRRDKKADAVALIERARASIDMFDVLEEFFGIVHPREGRSYKGNCPFGWEHPDGGIEKGWRTYPSTNTSFCFVQHGPLDAVRLIAIQKGIRTSEAARFLLDHYGLLKPKPWRERWAEVAQEREAKQDSIGAVSYLVEALQVALDVAAPGAQFETDVQEAMEQELESLEDILATASESDIRNWYAEAKSRLVRIATKEER